MSGGVVVGEYALRNNVNSMKEDLTTVYIGETSEIGGSRL
jgi:hypothetical protein